jgi:xanthine dehydrogenase molybdenum-binding subunit
MAELPYRVLSEYNYIGKRGVRPKHAHKKVCGTAIYTRDMYAPNMLHAKCLISPYTHAKIKSMDTSKAEALPGVWDILRYDDPNDKMATDVM